MYWIPRENEMKADESSPKKCCPGMEGGSDKIVPILSYPSFLEVQPITICYRVSQLVSEWCIGALV